MADTPLIDVQNMSKFFGSVVALKDITVTVNVGQVLCLLGDNGAGKSTLIKTLAGVHKPSEGTFTVEGKSVEFDSPRDALNHGIATVYQDLAVVPPMSVTRNFFMGREPTNGKGLLQRRSAASHRLASEALLPEAAGSDNSFHRLCNARLRMP